MPRRIARLLPLFAALAGCADMVPTPAEVLRVAAASDLEPAMPDLEAAFRRETGLTVRASFGASGTLARQIEQGAPFDLFLSADRKFVEHLAARGAIDPESVRAYAVGALSLAVHEEAGAGVATLDDLRRPEVRRIAIANPETAPYGRAAREALRAAGLWDELQPRIVLADNVRQVLQFVRTGNAEAGLVGRSTPGTPGVAAYPVDESLHPPIVQVLGVNASAREPAGARAFADFLLSGAGQAGLARHGFRPPRADAP